LSQKEIIAELARVAKERDSLAAFIQVQAEALDAERERVLRPLERKIKALQDEEQRLQLQMRYVKEHDPIYWQRYYEQQLPTSSDTTERMKRAIRQERAKRA